MRILFICGSMEPGRDGVGDYTRKLAAELISRQHKVKVIAFNDKFIKTDIEDNQLESNQKIQVLRLSNQNSLEQRKSKATQYSKLFKADWISVQYVPYAFSKQGVPIGLGRALRAMSINSNWHFMIHESYLKKPASAKNKIVRLVQIIALKTLLKIVKPCVVHTSIIEYQSHLMDIGIQTDILGLFGNIQIIKGVETKHSKNIKAVYFGAAPKEDVFDKFASELNTFLSNSSEDFELHFCGVSGSLGKKFTQYLNESVKHDNFQIIEHGRMEAEDLSELFSSAHVGISRVPPQLLGKSGAAISMLEHGIPLWIPLANTQLEIKQSFDFRVEQCFESLEQANQSDQKFKVESRLSSIVTQFLFSLER